MSRTRVRRGGRASARTSSKSGRASRAARLPSKDGVRARSAGPDSGPDVRRPKRPPDQRRARKAKANAPTSPPPDCPYGVCWYWWKDDSCRRKNCKFSHQWDPEEEEVKSASASASEQVTSPAEDSSEAPARPPKKEKDERMQPSEKWPGDAAPLTLRPPRHTQRLQQGDYVQGAEDYARVHMMDQALTPAQRRVLSRLAPGLRFFSSGQRFTTDHPCAAFERETATMRALEKVFAHHRLSVDAGTFCGVDICSDPHRTYGLLRRTRLPNAPLQWWEQWRATVPQYAPSDPLRWSRRPPAADFRCCQCLDPVCPCFPDVPDALLMVHTLYYYGPEAIVRLLRMSKPGAELYSVHHRFDPHRHTGTFYQDGRYWEAAWQRVDCGEIVMNVQGQSHAYRHGDLAWLERGCWSDGVDTLCWSSLYSSFNVGGHIEVLCFQLGDPKIATFSRDCPATPVGALVADDTAWGQATVGGKNTTAACEIMDVSTIEVVSAGPFVDYNDGKRSVRVPKAIVRAVQFQMLGMERTPATWAVAMRYARNAVLNHEFDNPQAGAGAITAAAALGFVADLDAMTGVANKLSRWNQAFETYNWVMSLKPLRWWRWWMVAMAVFCLGVVVPLLSLAVQAPMGDVHVYWLNSTAYSTGNATDGGPTFKDVADNAPWEVWYFVASTALTALILAFRYGCMSPPDSLAHLVSSRPPPLAAPLYVPTLEEAEALIAGTELVGPTPARMTWRDVALAPDPNRRTIVPLQPRAFTTVTQPLRHSITQCGPLVAGHLPYCYNTDPATVFRAAQRMLTSYAGPTESEDDLHVRIGRACSAMLAFYSANDWAELKLLTSSGDGHWGLIPEDFITFEEGLEALGSEKGRKELIRQARLSSAIAGDVVHAEKPELLDTGHSEAMLKRELTRKATEAIVEDTDPRMIESVSPETLEKEMVGAKALHRMWRRLFGPARFLSRVAQQRYVYLPGSNPEELSPLGAHLHGCDRTLSIDQSKWDARQELPFVDTCNTIMSKLGDLLPPAAPGTGLAHDEWSRWKSVKAAMRFHSVQVATRSGGERVPICAFTYMGRQATGAFGTTSDNSGRHLLVTNYLLRRDGARAGADRPSVFAWGGDDAVLDDAHTTPESLSAGMAEFNLKIKIKVTTGPETEVYSSQFLECVRPDAPEPLFILSPLAGRQLTTVGCMMDSAFLTLEEAALVKATSLAAIGSHVPVLGAVLTAMLAASKGTPWTPAMERALHQATKHRAHQVCAPALGYALTPRGFADWCLRYRVSARQVTALEAKLRSAPLLSAIRSPLILSMAAIDLDPGDPGPRPLDDPAPIGRRLAQWPDFVQEVPGLRRLLRARKSAPTPSAPPLADLSEAGSSSSPPSPRPGKDALIELAGISISNV